MDCVDSRPQTRRHARHCTRAAATAPSSGQGQLSLQESEEGRQWPGSHKEPAQVAQLPQMPPTSSSSAIKKNPLLLPTQDQLGTWKPPPCTEGPARISAPMGLADHGHLSPYWRLQVKTCFLINTYAHPSDSELCLHWQEEVENRIMQ